MEVRRADRSKTYLNAKIWYEIFALRYVFDVHIYRFELQVQLANSYLI